MYPICIVCLRWGVEGVSIRIPPRSLSSEKLELVVGVVYVFLRLTILVLDGQADTVPQHLSR